MGKDTNNCRHDRRAFAASASGATCDQTVRNGAEEANLETTRYEDLIGGGLLVAAGAFVAIYSYLNYNVGFGSQIGSGVFPLVLGLILLVLGFFILVPALAMRGVLPEFEFRPFFAVLGAAAVFAVLIDSVGMVPTVLSMTGIAALADRKSSLVRTLALAVGLSILAVVIFNIGPGVQISIAKWPL